MANPRLPLVFVNIINGRKGAQCSKFYSQWTILRFQIAKQMIKCCEIPVGLVGIIGGVFLSWRVPAEVIKHQTVTADKPPRLTPVKHHTGGKPLSCHSS